MYGGSDDLEERGGRNFDISFVLIDILTDRFGWVHIVTVTLGHIFHNLDQRLNQTLQVVVTMNLRE